MTENISERIDNAIRDIGNIQIMFRQKYGEECLADKEIAEVLKIAKAEHEELQQYRSIGTVEEIKKVIRFLSIDNDNGIIEDIEELNKYKLIGTTEECQEAMEKQKAKKPKIEVQDADVTIGCVILKAGTKTYWCPSCEKAITGTDNHCRWCGQAIDRSGTH